MFLRQFNTIMQKNWLINYRTKEFLRENVSVVIIMLFVIITENQGPNNFTTPFYLGIGVAGYSRSIAISWLLQKQSHQKQLQKVMGVSQKSFLLSWYAYFVLNGILITIVTMSLLYFFAISAATNFAEGYAFPDLAILFFLYSLSNIGFVLIICCFFSKAQSGSSAVTFIQLIINFLYFLRFAEAAQLDYVVFILSLFPQMSFLMSLSKVAFIDPTVSNYDFDITYQQGVITLIATIFIYPIIAFYLDQVLPKQEGTQKHPLFFLGLQRNPSQNELNLPLLDTLITQNQSSAKYEQKIAKQNAPIAKIANMSKSFKDNKVINNLSLNFYSSEIFCLLGHNGAGKSTTINLLTGLLTPNEGSVEILGMNYFQNIDEIRKNIGLCLQYNVLYDNLTVEDHLRFYYKIKCEQDEQIQNQVERIINECALIAEKGKFAKDLSGGNKRKLCLANSLIGGSKIIFLDEPSSGLDPNSRQAIWAILKNLQNSDRCVILTTHHLQEAQYLSKRIAIMSKGKLIIIGDKEFITDKFNSGYHITITLNKKKEKSAEICRQIIAKNIKKSIQDKQTAPGTIKFLLPLKELANFSHTLKLLQQAQIGLISVSLSNLQDAFIKIGEEQQNETEGFFQMRQKGLEERESVQQNLQKYQIKLPDVECSYSFSSQMKAVFLRKMKTTFRSLSTFVSVILPTLFIITGALITCLAIVAPEGQNPLQVRRIKLFVMSYFMIWAFIFNTSTYCGSVVLERQKRFKYLTNVSGTRQLPYWLGNYAFDLIVFYFPLCAYFIIIYSIGQSATFLTDFVGYLIVLFVLFGFSFIGYSYLFSFIFQKSTSAYKFFPFINLVFFYLLPLIPNITNPQGILAMYVMPLISPFVAFSIFFNTKEVVGTDSFQYFSLLWVSYGSLLLQAIVYFIVNLKLESLRFSLKSQLEQIPNQQVDHISQSSISQPIIIDRLSKIYGNGKVALRDSTFRVNSGQIFGLLGPNGAGKSTSFNIITAAMARSSGSVQLFGQQVNKGIMEIFQNIGVCPQYNPLYENMTVYQHLQYFCLIKGIDSSVIPQTIQFYCDLLSLTPYKQSMAGILSGGNKRKMCVAMAMIGNPKVAFFDEPSAGVDPISRRYLWKCLSESTKSKNTSMVLTTHSMNEAQSLCSSIGILIKGEFVCLDSPQKLKQKYGKGYRINVIANVNFHQQLIELVVRQFGSQIEVERLIERPQFIVFVIKNDRFSLSKGFELFQNKLIQNNKIERYEIKESTLEQVFIHLSRLQPAEQEQTFVQPWNLLCWQWGNNGCQIRI